MTVFPADGVEHSGVFCRQNMTDEESIEKPGDKAIVFFDGVCGLCNQTVQFLLDRDKRRRLHYAPLQGETAEQHVPAHLRESLSTLVYMTNGKIHIRSAAVARILIRLGGIWKSLGILMWLIPWPIRDLGYRLVSAMRYRIWGKYDSCRLPTLEERHRFLD